jgi:hypothetical protein
MKLVFLVLITISSLVNANDQYYSLYDKHITSLKYHEAATTLIPLMKTNPTLETAYRIGKAYTLIGTDDFKSKGLKFLKASAKRGHLGAIDYLREFEKYQNISDGIAKSHTEKSPLTRTEYIERISELKRYNRGELSKTDLTDYAKSGVLERTQFKIFIRTESEDLNMIMHSIRESKLLSNYIDIKSYLVVDSWEEIHASTTKTMERYPSLIMDIGGYHAKKHNVNAYPSVIKSNGINHESTSFSEIRELITNKLSTE